MGTTCYLISTHRTTREAIEGHLNQGLIPGERSGFGFEYLTVKGSTGYGVMYRQDMHTLDKVYFGIVLKTSRHRCDVRGMTEFCIKEITEDMGPVQTDAPAKMLDMLDRLAPNPTGKYAADWRAKCRAKLASKTAKTKPTAGQQVIYNGTTYTLRHPAGPRKGWIVTTDTDARYRRMNARQISEALRTPEPAPEPAPEPTPSKQVSPEEFFRSHIKNDFAQSKIAFHHIGA